MVTRLIHINQSCKELLEDMMNDADVIIDSRFGNFAVNE